MRSLVGKETQAMLSSREMGIISNNQMLNDNIINECQNILNCQFPRAHGLQNTLLGQNNMFNVYQTVPFVQVLHDGRLHWVAINTIGCKEGEIFYLDSLFNGRIADAVKMQICSIMCCSTPQLTIKVLSTQQQTNGVDCGLFAIAFIHTILTLFGPGYFGVGKDREGADSAPP